MKGSSKTIQAIKLSQLENELSEVWTEIRRCEGIINSVKVKNGYLKDKTKKKLERLIDRKEKLTANITEAALLDLEL